MMRLLDLLRDTHRPRPTGVPAIQDWRANIVHTKRSDVAVRHRRFGGPYNPPTTSNLLEANIFIRWADGLCTKAILNRNQITRTDEILPFLYEQAYPEPFPDAIPEMLEPSDVRVYAEEVSLALTSEPERLVRPLHVLEEALDSVPTQDLRSNLSAYRSDVTFATSHGAEVSHRATRVQYSMILAALAWFVHETRSLPTDESLAARARRVRQDYLHLEKPYEGAFASKNVYLSPWLSNQFFNYFLKQNMAMQAILNHTSAFRMKDLAEQRQLFHPSVSIEDSPTRDMHPTAFRLDDRGLPPSNRFLVKEGRLLGVDVSPRAATQAGILPTPTSLTSNWLLGEAPESPVPPNVDLETCLRTVDEGLYIYAVLGLHTQDASRGSYSLGVPRALVIRDGRIKGHIRGTLTGNFFDDLRVPLAPLQDPLAEKPILAIQGAFKRAD